MSEEWISVKERLPERDGFYLTYDIKRISRWGVDEYIVTTGFGFWYDSIDGASLLPPSYWMPLPEPPEARE